MILSLNSKLDITRPADATAYGAGDVVGPSSSTGGGVLKFDQVGGEGSAILITDADLRIDLSSVTSGMTSWRLHLYSRPPGSQYADNTAWDLPAVDREAYLGYVEMGTIVDVGATLFVQAGQVNKKIYLGYDPMPLYGYLVTTGAYTPASGTTMSLRLNGIPC